MSEAPTSPPPIYVFEGGALDLEALLRRLDRPDFVLLRGAEYDRLRQGAEARPETGAAEAVIEAVTVTGQVEGLEAHLRVELVARLRTPGPHWLGLGLDGRVLQDVREGDRACPVRQRAGAGWEAEVRGEGTHRLLVSILVPVLDEPDGKKIDCAIPTAASTRVDIEVHDAVKEANSGLDEPIQVEPGPTSGLVRLRASLAPRDRLAILWRTAPGPGAEGPAVLTARGEIAVDVLAGSFQSRSTWSIQCERGVARQLAFRLSGPDELLGVELDDQPISIDEQRDADLVTLPLNQPLTAGNRRRLTITTRRRLPIGEVSEVEFKGVPFVEMVTQTGIVAIVQGAEVWVGGAPGRGLRSIDPRELTDSLRARPSTVQAYQFIDQPFELTLRVGPSPPQIAVNVWARFAIEPTRARATTRFDYEASRGRVTEARVPLAEGVEVEAVGPPDVIDSFQVVDEPAGAGRALIARLNASAVSDGAYRVEFTTRQPITMGDGVTLALLRPSEANVSAMRIRVDARRELGVALETAHAPRSFLVVGPGPAAEWPDRPGGAGEEEMNARFDLEAEPDAHQLAVRIEPRSFELRQVTTVRVTARREALEVEQTTRCQLRNGSAYQFDLEVPGAWDGRWELSGWDAATRDSQVRTIDQHGRADNGRARSRILLDREVADWVELRFRARVPHEPLTAARPHEVELPWIVVLGGETQSVRVEVASEPGLDVRPLGQGWTSTAPEGLNDGAGALGASWEGARSSTPPTARLTAARPAPMPSTVASRLWLRSARKPDGSIQSTAWFRVENHQGAFTFTMPAEARLIRARLAAEAIAVERLPEGGALLVRLPVGESGPQLVGIDYTTSGDWAAPTLAHGGVVQHTVWEVNVPSNDVLLGAPPGWVDRNSWWPEAWFPRRRAAWPPVELAAWIGLPAEVAVHGEGPWADSGALFSRPGSPQGFRPTIWPGWAVVGLCSGLVLGVGVLLIWLRVPGRLAWALVLLSVGLIAAAIAPGLMLQLAQASLPGLLLTLIAVLIHGFVERGRGTSVASDSTSLAPYPTTNVGSSRPSALAVSDEESTVVRHRASSTIDYVPTSDPEA